jgi:regulator of sigma E protease
MIFTILVFLVVLSVLIFAHELGHFLTARRFGVRAEEFGFGFPPRLFGIYKDKQGKWRRVHGNREVTDAADTVYSINSIPLGGFVKIKGEDGDGRNEKDSFGAHPIWQRLIIISAGVLMNIVLAWVLITASYFGGVPTTSDHGDIMISETMSNSPAAKADIRPYDKIISISGQNFTDITNIQNFIGYSAGHELDIKLQRGQDIIDKKVTPEAKTGSKAMIGVALIQIEIVHYPWYQALWQGARSTATSLWIILTSFLDLLRQAVVGKASGDAIGGPIQIAQMTGTVARVGFLYLLQFVALLSLNLAVINFFPFPALDGGRFLFLIIEKIKGKPMKRELETAMNNIGFYLLLALIAWVTIKDIIKLF